ncbi:MAG: hypothetical protein PHT59_06600 [Candidatus Omnitrophica bacterium]|nr:hypothetical protein [Candidatus Omnitrophota bacterium]
MTAQQQPEPGKHCGHEGPIFEEQKKPRGYCDNTFLGKKCIHSSSEYYCIEDGNDCDSGFNYYCNHPSVGKKKTPAHHGEVPDWCPCEHDTRQRKGTLSEYLGSCSMRELAEYVISTMGRGFGECDSCQKDALEALRSRPLSCMERNGAQGQRKEIDDVICINEISLALKRFRDGKLQEMVAVKKIWSLFEEMQAQPQDAAAGNMTEPRNPQMRCAAFHRLSCVIPPNCYNCVHRSGWPTYLFGHKDCKNFVKMPPGTVQEFGFT